MPNQDFLRKIKDLKRITPSQEWVSSTRRILMEAEDAERSSVFGYGGTYRFIAAGLSALVLLVVGPLAVFGMAKQSLPGEFLYPVKKISENLKVKMTPENQRERLEFDFASRRIEEVSRFNQEFFTSNDQNTVDSQKTVKALAGELSEVARNLKDNSGGVSKEEIAAMTARTKAAQKSLESSENNQKEEQLTKELTAAVGNLLMVLEDKDASEKSAFQATTTIFKATSTDEGVNSENAGSREND